MAKDGKAKAATAIVLIAVAIGFVFCLSAVWNALTGGPPSDIETKTFVDWVSEASALEIILVVAFFIWILKD